ncbi:MAG: hypothetical protein LBC78_04455, partial [Oscillospiraceae bacterium]|nr:hypothetical protein [Oscillospiraceae bacterium]
MAGFWTYLRFIARRERIVSAIWAAALVLFTFATAAYFPSLFPDEAARASVAEMLKSPAMIGMMGPVYGGAAPSAAMLFSQEMSVWMFIASAVMNIFLVNRHTRSDEELGRLEMFRSLPVGQLTGAFSVMKFVFALNLIIAVFTTLLVSASGIGGDFAGAAAYSFAVFGVGVFFAAVTLLLAQLLSTSRGVSGAALAVLGLSYMLRAAGDISGSALSV